MKDLVKVSYDQAMSLKGMGLIKHSDDSKELYVTSNEVTWDEEIEIPYSDRYEYVTHREVYAENIVGKLLYDVSREHYHSNRFKYQTVFAPSLELAARWLRDEKDFGIFPHRDTTMGGYASSKYKLQITLPHSFYEQDPDGYNSLLGLGGKEFDSYDESLSFGIDIAIRLFNYER